MNQPSFFSGVMKACGVVVLALLPALSPDGSLWVLAIVCAIVAYEGFHAVYVYAGGVLIIISEALYGLDVAVISLSFVLAVIILLGIRRFISLAPWSQQDGWSVGDGLKSILTGWLFFAVTLSLSSFVGGVLFGYGAILRRLGLLWVTDGMAVSLALGALTQIALRRMAIPFRRAILFGS